MRYSLGIDVGATTCSAGASGGASGGAPPEPRELSDGAYTMPAVALPRRDGTVLVGPDADRLCTYEPALVARMVTAGLFDPEPVMVDGVPCHPLPLTEGLLDDVIARATQDADSPPEHIMVAYPLRDDGGPERLLAEAAHRATGGTAVLVPAPIAAAAKLAYDRDLGPDALVAVVDFGGTSVDVALVRCTPEVFDLIGDPVSLTDLGGVDLDAAVVTLTESAIGDVTSTVPPSDRVGMLALRRLRASCRAAKERLAFDDAAIVDVALPHARAQVEITREAFDTATAPMFEAAVDLVLVAIEDAGLIPADLSTALLVGGCARFPQFSGLVAERTGLPVVVDDEPELTVALGASLFGDVAERMPGIAHVPTPGPGRAGMPTAIPAPGSTAEHDLGELPEPAEAYPPPAAAASGPDDLGFAPPPPGEAPPFGDPTLLGPPPPGRPVLDSPFLAGLPMFDESPEVAGASPFGPVPPAPGPAPVAPPAPFDPALLGPLPGDPPPAGPMPFGQGPLDEPPVDATAFDAPPFLAPPPDTPPFDQPAVGAPPFDPPAVAAPSFEAAAFEAPPFDAPPFEAPPFEAPPFEAPPFEAPPFEAPPFEAPPREAPPFETPSDLPPLNARPGATAFGPLPGDPPPAGPVPLGRPPLDAHTFDAPAFDGPAFDALYGPPDPGPPDAGAAGASLLALPSEALPGRPPPVPPLRTGEVWPAGVDAGWFDEGPLPAGDWNPQDGRWDDARTSVFDDAPQLPAVMAGAAADDGDWGQPPAEEFRRLTTSDTDPFRSRSSALAARLREREEEGDLDDYDDRRGFDLRLVVGGAVAALFLVVLAGFAVLSGSGDTDPIAVADTVPTTNSPTTEPATPGTAALTGSPSTTSTSTTTTTAPEDEPEDDDPPATEPPTTSPPPVVTLPPPPPPPPPTTTTTRPRPTTTSTSTTSTSTTSTSSTTVPGSPGRGGS